MDGSRDVPLYRFRLGTATFDESRLELSVAGLIVDMEQKPLQVLTHLLSRVDEVCSRQELHDAVWGRRVTVENVLYNAIRKLRIAIGDEAGERIVTVPKIGYKLIGPVKRTAIGRRLVSRLELRAKQAVPGRPTFILQEQIGTTRSSEVWLAQHADTGERRVYKFCADGGRLSALKREAKLGRYLRESLQDREDIARIIDWNFETPPFFLECEFGGVNLATWALDDAQLAVMPQEGRIALFLAIADAVAAAHSVGVLHKDLKPANILVAATSAGGWQIRVTDFGSGELLEPGVLEELGMTQLGMTATVESAAPLAETTPMYVAPELVAGIAPTVQSDLYALGLILYQLVAGDLRRPIAPGWESAIADDLVRDDIAAATHGDPAKRLTSVAELAHRLRGLDQRRALQTMQRQTEARLAAARKSGERMEARRPWLVLSVAFLILGLSISLWLYREQWAARLRAEREERRTEAINRFLTDDLLGAADPSGPSGAHNPSMRDVLASTSARLTWAFANDPGTKAAIEVALGSAYFGISDYPNAEKYRRAAFETLKNLYGAADSRTLEAEYPLISVYVQSNRLDEAASMLDSADRLSGDRLNQNSKLAYNAHWARAAYEKLRMKPDMALVEYQAADRVRVVLDPNNDSLMVRLRDALSWCYARLNRNEEAEQVLRGVITPVYSPERIGPVFWAQARIDYGIALKTNGKNTDAEKYLVDAVSETRRSLGADHFFVGVAENELADLEIRENRWTDAENALQSAYAIIREHTGDHGQATLIVGANLGVVEYRTGHSAQAVEILRSVHDELAGQLGSSSPQAEVVAYYLACAMGDLGHYRDAATLIAPISVSNLTAAEPRKDWAERLEALNGSILTGLDRTREGVAKLSDAIARMRLKQTPEEDLAPFRRMFELANKAAAKRST